MDATCTKPLRGRPSPGVVRSLKALNDRKEVVHDRTTQTNDRGSSAAELLRQHDSHLHQHSGRFRSLLSQVTGQAGSRGDPAVSTLPAGREKARLVNVRAADWGVEVLLHTHTQTALVRAGGRQAQGATPAADRTEPRGSYSTAGCHAEPEASGTLGNALRHRIAV